MNRPVTCKRFCGCMLIQPVHLSIILNCLTFEFSYTGVYVTLSANFILKVL